MVHVYIRDICVFYVEQGRVGGRENMFFEGSWGDAIWPLFSPNETETRVFSEREKTVVWQESK